MIPVHAADTASIQLSSSHSTPNHHVHAYYHQYEHEHPKRALLATVRAAHARGRCRQTQVRQMLADTGMCQGHDRGNPRGSKAMVGMDEVEEAEEADDNEHITCSRHDTPSHVPLICHPPMADPPPPPSPFDRHHHTTSPSVPASLVLVLFVGYVCAGAAAFASATGWTFLDAAYFCFIALSTIGVGDRMPQSADATGQLQLLACCFYLVLGLVVVATCFSLVQDEVALKCRHLAGHVGLLK